MDGRRSVWPNIAKESREETKINGEINVFIKKKEWCDERKFLYMYM